MSSSPAPAPAAAPVSTPTSTTVDLPELFRQVCCLPDVVGASWISNGNESAPDVVVSTSQRDIVLDAKRPVHTHYRAIDEKTSPLSYATTFSAPTTDVLAYVPSPSGKFALYIKKGPTKPNASKDAPPNFVFDIVTRTGRLILSKHTEKHHGRIFTNGILGGITWSSDETRIVYVADPLSVNAQSFYATEADPKSAHLARGTEYEYKEDWGEVYTGVISPRIYMLHVVQTAVTDSNMPTLIQGHITTLEGIPEGITVGQVVITPDNSGVLVTGWQHQPRKLGLVHYNTRESAIYYLPFTTSTDTATPISFPLAAANTVASYVKKEDKKQDDGEKKKEETDAEREEKKKSIKID